MKGIMKRPGRLSDRGRGRARKKDVTYIGGTGVLPTEQGNSSIAVNRVEKAGGLLTLKCSFLNSSLFLSFHPLPSSLSLSPSLSLPLSPFDNCAPSPGCVVMIAI